MQPSKVQSKQNTKRKRSISRTIDHNMNNIKVPAYKLKSNDKSTNEDRSVSELVKSIKEIKIVK